MKTFTTLFDANYLDKAIALYESLNRFLDDYKLYCLCLDDGAFNKIKEINDKRLIPLHIKDELQEDEDFKTLVKYNESVPAGEVAKKGKIAGLSDFHFALGSFFTNHIMVKEQPEDILYIDSDIIFYHSPELIYDSMVGNSIGLILHRHVAIGKEVGGYNVGIVYFRNDETGRGCLKWWRFHQL